MPRGGKRIGAGYKNGVPTGRPKGGHNQATLTANEQKAVARQTIRDHVISFIPEIVRAQRENAMGVAYMVLRAPDGSFVRATDVKQMDAALASGEAAYRIYTKEPHQGSASMLLSYAADKPVEPLEVSGEGGGPVVFTWQK